MANKKLINWVFLPVKLHYLIFCTALACVLPFRTVFAKQMGISATATGFIFLAVPFLKVVTNPLIGYIIDSLKKFRLILGILLVTVGLSNMLLLYIPPLHEHGSNFSNKSLFFDHSCPINESYSLKGCGNSESPPFHLLCHLHCLPSSTIGNDDPAMNSCEKSIVSKSRVEVEGRGCNFAILAGNSSGFLRFSGSDNETVPQTFSASKQLPCPCGREMSCRAFNCEHHEDSTEMREEVTATSEFATPQFWSMFFLIAISSVSMCAVMFLVDTVCYELLKNDRDKFGYQRLWGTIGWGLGALAGGYINMAISGDVVDYSWSFYAQALILALNLIPVWQMEVDEVPYSPQILKDVGRLLSQREVSINLLVVLITGILSGLIWNYQFWFMEEIGSSQLVMGLSQTVECLASEVPCFLISGWLIRKIGYGRCYDLTFFTFCIRYLCFAFMTDPWMTLPVGLLQGPTFGIFYAAMTMYGKNKAPAGTEATVQALLAMAFEGVGVGLGSVLGGIGFDRIGSRNTFLCAAVISGAALIFRLAPSVVRWVRGVVGARLAPTACSTPIEEYDSSRDKITRLSIMLKV